ncbi:MAG: hypothetical protein Q4C53_06220 [Clostridia bacterium]|nr:hypothetical protein [Clostridia bacterium]
MLKRLMTAALALLMALPGFAAAGAEESVPPAIEIVRNERREDGTAVQWDTLRLTKGTKGYTALGETLKRDAGQRDTAKKDLLRELNATARQLKRAEPLYEISQLQVVRVDTRVLSAEIVWEGDYGGAHGDHGTETLNLDVATGKPIRIADAVTDMSGFAEALKSELTKHYDPADLNFLDEYLEGLKAGNNEPAFSIGADCVNVYFGSSEISPYAAGAESATIRFAEYPGLFAEKVTALPEQGVYRIGARSEGKEIVWRMDAADGAFTLKAKPTVDAEYTAYEALELTVNGATDTLADLMFYDAETYVLKNGDALVLWVFDRSDNDYVTLNSANLRAGAKWNRDGKELSLGGVNEESKKGSSRDVLRVLADPATVCLATTCDVLGTYAGEATYAVDANGVPQRTDEAFRVSPYSSIESTVKLKGIIVNEDGKGTKQTTVGKGSEMKVYRTDGTRWENTSYVDVKLSKGGKIVRFTYGEAKDGGFGAMVAGIAEEKAFKSLPYAG